MENQLEYFDLIANAQKQAINSLVSVQNDAATQWLDALGKAQDNLFAMPGVPDAPQAKEALNQFKTWFGSATSNAKQVHDAVVTAQKLWISAYSKQVQVGRGVLEGAIDFGQAVTKTA